MSDNNDASDHYRHIAIVVRHSELKLTFDRAAFEKKLDDLGFVKTLNLNMDFVFVGAIKIGKLEELNRLPEVIHLTFLTDVGNLKGLFPNLNYGI